MVRTGPAPARTGAPLIFVVATTEPALKSVAVSRVELVRSPGLPADWSQARTVSVAGAVAPAAAVKRTRSAGPSRSATVPETGPTPAQVLPASSEYSHTPLPAAA